MYYIQSLWHMKIKMPTISIFYLLFTTCTVHASLATRKQRQTGKYNLKNWRTDIQLNDFWTNETLFGTKHQKPNQTLIQFEIETAKSISIACETVIIISVLNVSMVTLFIFSTIVCSLFSTSKWRTIKIVHIENVRSFYFERWRLN